MMHSLTQRTSSLTSTISSALFTIAILVSILTYVSNTFYSNDIRSLRIKNIKPLVNIKNTRNYGGTKDKPKENARFKFDLVADFADLVDWNTKQIFTYIYVEFDDDYSNSKGSKMIIWDKILDDTSKMYINTKNLKSKYSIWDYSPDLKGRTGHFKLGYNIQPYIGPLTFAEIDLNQSVILPNPKI